MYCKNIWTNASEDKKEKIFSFCEGYKTFLTDSKTERDAVSASLEILKKEGFVDLYSLKEIKPGDKVYAINKNKNILACVIGDKPIEEGMRILGAHIDSPRLDIKQNPLYEKCGFALLNTHYYGGIKKYQYVTIPLAIHGVVYKKNGEKVDINIGEDENDPMISVNDLLIHLSAAQIKKPAMEVIDGEDLDITVGNIPLKDDKSGEVKNYLIELIKNKYGIEEEDFVSSDLCAVPAIKAKDYGLDRSMIAGYGHDDKVCAYTSLMAIVDQGKCDYTTMAVLVDKEEVGSIGATGAQSKWFENVVAELLFKQGNESFLAIRHAMEKSKMLSSDVSAAVDPLYPSVNDMNNSCYFSKGIVINKYTGSAGKRGANDAMPEFIAFVRKVFDENDIYYQSSELGKVDAGGGGTIAYILGNYNMEVLDAGVAVLSMHSPMEIVSKADVYETYLAYRAFIRY